jgi:DNA-binding MltR family transcriptional regulator
MTGRNQLCPCGSGKKYKRCCLLKGNTPVSEEPLSSHVAPGGHPKGDTKPSEIDDWNAFSEELHKESDRAAAVLGAAYLDALLEDLLRAFFIDDPAEVNPLLAPDGPAGAFGARIRLAYGLGLLAKDEYFDLKTVQKIRNRFAHDLHGLDFSENSISDRCRNLRMPDAIFPRRPDWLLLPRSKYIFSVVVLSQSIASRASSVKDVRCTTPEWEIKQVGDTGAVTAFRI